MKSVLRRTLAALILLAAVSAMSLLSLPVMLDHWVIPALLKRVSLENTSVQITRVTPFSATGTFNMEPGGEPLLAVPRFKILFNPASLFKKRVSMLVLDHAVVHLARQDGKIRPIGFTESEGSGTEGSGSWPPALPFMLDTLVLKQCSLVLHEMQQPDLRISVSGRIDPLLHSRAPSSFEFGGLDGTLVFTDGLSATGRLHIEVGSAESTIELQLENGHLQLPRQFIPESLDIGYIGPFAASSRLQLDNRTRTIRHLELQAQLAAIDFSNNRLDITAGNPGREMSISLSGPPSNLSYAAGPITIHSPLRLTAELNGTIVADKPVLYTEGVLKSVVYPGPGVDDVSFPLTLTHNFTYIPGGDWLLKFSGSSQSDVQLPFASRKLTLALPNLGVEGEANGIGMNGNGRIELLGDAARITHADTPFDLDNFDLRILLHRQDGRTQARLAGTVDRVSSTALPLAMDNIRFKLPLMLPVAPGARSGGGGLSVETLRYQGVNLATLDSTIKQRGATFRLEGNISALFDPSLQISVDSTLSPTSREAVAAWRLQPSSIDAAALPLLPPSMDGVEFGGTLEASGDLRFGNRGTTGTMRAQLQDGYFRIPEKNLEVDNIGCTLSFPGLPVLASRPSQRCTFDTLDLGTFFFSNGLVDFRIEDGRTIFVEKSRVRWAQGSLESGSIRLSADTREIDTTLFASRINFSDLLNQFGFDQTDGQGSLNGRLPVRLSEQGLDFDDGFLFSTPGTGGIVRFTNTEMLSQAMGSVIEASYLEYSLMALEDFAYNWTRLSFNSSGNDLLMTMELDGRPRTPLPFGFKDGMIIATDQGEGLQYPIRLDVNFNLPLNELLKVGTNLKSIMEK